MYATLYTQYATLHPVIHSLHLTQYTHSLQHSLALLLLCPSRHCLAASTSFQLCQQPPASTNAMPPTTTFRRSLQPPCHPNCSSSFSQWVLAPLYWSLLSGIPCAGPGGACLLPCGFGQRWHLRHQMSTFSSPTLSPRVPFSSSALLQVCAVSTSMSTFSSGTLYINQMCSVKLELLISPGQ